MPWEKNHVTFLYNEVAWRYPGKAIDNCHASGRLYLSLKLRCFLGVWRKNFKKNRIESGERGRLDDPG